VIFNAPDIKLFSSAEKLNNQHPFNIALNIVKKLINTDLYPACNVLIKSTVPIASGLGSSAAISVALIKALSSFVGLTLSKTQLADLSYKVEIQYHGTPSGIDNTVIAYDQPILFKKNEGFRILNPTSDFTFILANSGIAGQTKKAVTKVRHAVKNEPEKYNNIFEKIGSLVYDAEKSISNSDYSNLGTIMNTNHQLLQSIGVSHSILDNLVNKSIESGAFGAKLCGGGLGGNIIALVKEEEVSQLSEVLEKAGATQTICFHLRKGEINE
jgi:mevalonate kinase